MRADQFKRITSDLKMDVIIFIDSHVGLRRNAEFVKEPSYSITMTEYEISWIWLVWLGRQKDVKNTFGST